MTFHGALRARVRSLDHRPAVVSVAALVCVVLLPIASPAADPGASSNSHRLHRLPKDAHQFLQSNCIDCHDGEEGEGGFDASTLLDQPIHADSKALHQWVRIFDRVHDGEMPPTDYGEVDEVDRTRFLSQTREVIESTLEQAHAENGRVVARRLTNAQLESSLCQLLGVRLPLARMIPEETRVNGFRNIASAQSISHYHLEDHLRVVDHALDYAWQRASGAIDADVISFPANRIANKRRGQRNRDPEMREGAAVVWSCTMPYYGRISNSRIRESGWYDITLEASAVKPPKSGTVWCSIRNGECVSRAPLMYWIDSFEVTEEPQTFEFRAWLDEGHLLEVQPADRTLRKARFRGGQVGFGEGEPQNVPGIAMHSLKLKRVFPGGDESEVRERLFGDLAVSARRGRTMLDSTVDKDELKRAVSRFASRAFRSPASEAELEPYFRWIDEQVSESKSAARELDQKDSLELLRQVYRAILCSPRFIYFSEQPGKLSDHAIASRLSYLLTGRAADRRLRAIADRGELSKPSVLVAETRRLLGDDAHFEAFVADFCDQWLELADISFTEPDSRMFSDFDLIVQNAFVEETRRFVGTLIRENSPASQLVDADFTWLNGRLAAYYGIDSDLQPTEWKRVSLADHPHRGGLLTHGSVLKVTANGTNTSPVVRGVWVCDRLLGIAIPEPPENVPAIEPDIRGAKTVRQILEKHRSQTECASCHARIDPPGFALEHFDAAGRYRDSYLKRQKGKYVPAAKIDAAYELADGRSFESFQEFRALAATSDEAIAKNFAAKLLAYGTGREVTFADRQVLDKIARQVQEKNYGLRSIIEAVVTSETFLNK